MNRRHLLLATSAFAAGSLPHFAVAQTPIASPTQDEAMGDDTRALDLVEILQSISPVELLRMLQTAPPATNALSDVAIRPWVDFDNTTLHSSVGGMVMMFGGDDIQDPNAEMLGGYIVYESVEIAYHEFVRKLGPAYDIPSTTMSVAGTTIWDVSSDTTRISVARIGYVMPVANEFESTRGRMIDVVIDHLLYVASRVDA